MTYKFLDLTGLKQTITQIFSKLKAVALSGSYTDLINKPTIVNNGTTTTTNTVLDGRMGKTLADKDANLQSQITSLNSAFAQIWQGTATKDSQINIDVSEYTQFIFVTAEGVLMTGSKIYATERDKNIITLGGSGNVWTGDSYAPAIFYANADIYESHIYINYVNMMTMDNQTVYENRNIVSIYGIK